MKFILATAVVFCSLHASQAMAQNNCTAGPFLSRASLATLLQAGRYACGSTLGTPSADSWDELHSGAPGPAFTGTFTQVGKGPRPYTLTAPAGGGVVTYDYGPGNIFSYRVTPVTGTAFTTTPGDYIFCMTAPVSTRQYTIRISTAPSTPGSCPVNP
jgi:hypothetical protein